VTEGRPAALPRAIVLLGLTSLLTDVSSDMITPLLPAFLVGVLGARATALGAIEGAADAVSSLLRWVSGRLSDRLPRRKPLVVAGYALASFTRPLMGLATAPWHALAIRVGDRIGKGIRTPPRDALIADAAPPGQAGRAFGFHRAMDHAGAVLGPLIAAGLIAAGLGMREVFLWAAVPAALAMVAALAVREPARLSAPAGAPALVPARLPARLRSLLVIVLAFSLAASSDAFVLLRAQQVGVPLWGIPLLAAALSVVKMSLSPIAGAWSDRIGRLPLVVSGWLVYALSYAALAFVSSAWPAVVVVLLYGTYHGLTESTERALVADLAPAVARGRAYGAYNAVVGIAALPAGLLTGWLWERASPEAALLTCAGLALVATAALAGWARPARS
jgi:MFS family permease